MASVIYNSCIDDIARGNIVLATDTFYIVLVTSGYNPDKDGHAKRIAVTDEVVGAGYSAGGKVTSVTVTKDLANDRVDAAFASVQWTNASVTARGCVIYKRRGGDASIEELVAYVDFGQDYTAQGGTFEVSFSSPFRFQN